MPTNRQSTQFMLFAIVVMSLIVLPRPTYGQEERLFMPTTEMSVANTSDASVTRQQVVSLNSRIEGAFVADFFGSEVQLTITSEKVDADGREYFVGRTVNSEETDIRLIRENGQVSGVFYMEEGTYKLVPTESSSISTLEQIEIPNLPDGHIYVTPEELPTLPVQTAANTLSATSDKELDLTVFYTNRAVTADRNIENSIRLAVARFNDALYFSGVDLTVNLLAIQAASDFSETRIGESDLVRFANKTDGTSDWIHAERDRRGADVVVLITGDNDVCGIGFIMTTYAYTTPNYDSSERGFSLVNVNCLASTTLAHEVGHNLGADHNHDEDHQGVFNYSYGYRAYDSEGRCVFITIMSYNPSSGVYRRINRFSNPELKFEGYPTGDAFANNALTINQTKVIATQWRTNPNSIPASISITTPGVVQLGQQSIVLEGDIVDDGITTKVRLFVNNAEYVAQLVSDTHWRYEISLNGTPQDFIVVAQIGYTPVKAEKTIIVRDIPYKSALPLVVH